MRLIRTSSYDEMSEKAAEIIAAQILLKPNTVLGLATGSTPLGTYALLAEGCRAGKVDFSQVTTINLDEYKGISRSHDQSYWYFMHEHLFNHVNIREENVFVPNGENPDSEAACKEYDEIIENHGGIDLQLLGIGHDGHIGFNEPGPAFVPNTNCVKLTEMTIDANSRFFSTRDEVPKEAYTMGIKAIMQAKRVLMVVNGEEKAQIIYDAVCGPITPENPASILQLHPDFTLIVDKEAGKLFV